MQQDYEHEYHDAYEYSKLILQQEEIESLHDQLQEIYNTNTDIDAFINSTCIKFTIQQLVMVTELYHIKHDCDKPETCHRCNIMWITVRSKKQIKMDYLSDIYNYFSKK
jgi:tmRNA-binding protein